MGFYEQPTGNRAGGPEKPAFVPAGTCGTCQEERRCRPIVERLLDLVGGKLPEEAATFRDYYLDGEKQPSARQIARRRFVDTRTIYRHNRVILSAMLVPVFGVNGYFRMDSEQEPYQETAQERKRAYDREYHRQRREKAKGAARDRQETVGKTRER